MNDNRETAISAALQFHALGSATDDDVIATASKFEAFLNGGDAL